MAQSKKEAVTVESIVDKTDTKKLKEMTRALNDSELLSHPIKVVARKKEDILRDFLKEVKAIPDEKENLIPAAVVDYFNEVVALFDKADAGKTDQTAKPSVKEKPPVHKAPAAAGEYKPGSWRALTHSEVLSGKSHDEIVAAIVARGKTEKQADGLVRWVLDQMKQKGAKISVHYKIVEG